jgi:hypothetical protein
MADIIYTSFKRRLGDGTFDLDADTFKCALLTASHTPSAAHTVFADLTGEVSGTGYTAGGTTLTNVTWTTAGTTAVLDADDPAWTGATVTARYAVVYKSGTANGLANPLVCLLDFGADTGVTGGTFTVNFNTNGIVVLS